MDRGLMFEQSVNLHSTKVDNQLGAMSKVEVMDIYISTHKKMDGKEIRMIVNEIFNINLDLISAKGEGSKLSIYSTDIMEAVRKSLKLDPASTKLDTEIMAITKVEVMNKYMHSHGEQITGSEIRTLINEIFGVNLTGISSLDKARMSIFSKGQWILQNANDVMTLYSGKGDVDIKVYPTAYFIEQTGLSLFPAELNDFLLDLGFTYDMQNIVYNYTSSTGESVSDAFKGQLIEKLVSFIKINYSNL